MTVATEQRMALGAMYAGLAASAAALAVAFVDHATGNVLAEHIRAGYPGYDQARVDGAVSAYLIILAVVGALGIFSWVGAIRAVQSERRWAPALATGLFASGTLVALCGLLVKDTSGEPGLPALLGWVGMAPCLAGAVAVALLWRRP